MFAHQWNDSSSKELNSIIAMHHIYQKGIQIHGLAMNKWLLNPKFMHWSWAVTSVTMNWCIGTRDLFHSVHENHQTHRTFPMARPKYLTRDFINSKRIYKAHRTNAWWTMKVFQLHWFRYKDVNFLVEFWIQLNLFLRVQLAIKEHWFRWWLGAEQATSHYLNQWWPRSVTHINMRH